MKDHIDYSDFTVLYIAKTTRTAHTRYRMPYAFDNYSVFFFLSIEFVTLRLS